MKKFFQARWPEIFLSAIITILITVWFRSGMVLGTGESGLPFYNTPQLFFRNRYAWADVIIGSPTNQQGWPFLAFISAGQALHLPLFLIQAAFYWLIFIIGVLCVIKLSRFLSSSSLVAFLAGGFYLLNLFTLVSVVNRMLYPFLFIYAWLPLGLLILTQAFKTYRLHLAILLSVVSLPFSLAFASFPLLELWWGVVLLWCIYSAVTGSQNKLFSLKFFLLSLASWILVHLWWFGPLLISTFSSSYASTEAITTQGNIQAFSALSNLVGGTSYVLSLVDRSFFTSTSAAWGKFYLHPIIQLLALIPAAIVLSYPLERKKSDLSWFLFLVFLLTVFFAKGSTPPFGELATWLISYIRPLEVFRNAFEKTGFLLILCASLLFGHQLAKFPKRLIVIIMALVFGVLVYPLWTGQVIEGDQVVQPSYYTQANNWLESQPKPFRVIALPLTGEGATYTWPFRYSGVELSSEQFSAPIISMTTSVPYLSDITYTLESSLANKKTLFPIITAKLNSSYLILRRDLSYKARQIMDPQKAIEKITSLPNFIKQATFSDLEIYSTATPSALPWLFATTDVTYSYPKSSFSDLMLIPDPATTTLLEPVTISVARSSTLIKPKKDFIIPPSSNLSPQQAMQTLPAIRYLPSDPLFPLILIKERLERLTTSQDTVSLLRFDLNILGKRLVEISQLAQRSDPLLPKAILRYKAQLASIFHSNNSLVRIKSVTVSSLVNTLSPHLVIFKESPTLQPLYSELHQTMAQAGLASLYPQIPGPVRILRFDIPREGNYEVRIEPEDLHVPFNYKIDGQASTSSVLTGGLHEIAIELPQTKDISPLTGEYTFITPGSPPFQFFAFRPNSHYILELDYLINRGNGFETRFVQDIDYVSKDENRSYQHQRVNKDGYQHGWQHFVFEFKSAISASSGYLEFAVPPYNYCPQSKYPIIDRCSNLSYSERFNKPGEVSIKNVHVYRVFTNPVYLYQESKLVQASLPQVSYTKVNPTKYNVTISSAKSPFVLILSQLKDSGWKISPSFQPLLANGFANAWYINKTGDFELTVEYTPQKYLQFFRISSFVSLVFMCAYIWQKK